MRRQAQAFPQARFCAAGSLGADAEHVDSIATFGVAMLRARESAKTTVIVIDTDPLRATEAGGWWWEVGVPEVSEADSVMKARAEWAAGKRRQRN